MLPVVFEEKSPNVPPAVYKSQGRGGRNYQNPLSVTHLPKFHIFPNKTNPSQLNSTQPIPTHPQPNSGWRFFPSPRFWVWTCFPKTICQIRDLDLGQVLNVVEKMLVLFGGILGFWTTCTDVKEKARNKYDIPYDVFV